MQKYSYIHSFWSLFFARKLAFFLVWKSIEFPYIVYSNWQRSVGALKWNRKLSTQIKPISKLIIVSICWLEETSSWTSSSEPIKVEMYWKQIRIRLRRFWLILVNRKGKKIFSLTKPDNMFSKWLWTMLTSLTSHSPNNTFQTSQ